jgi:hypothetical protein
MVGAPRFELGTPSPPDWCANRAALRSEWWGTIVVGGRRCNRLRRGLVGGRVVVRTLHLYLDVSLCLAAGDIAGQSPGSKEWSGKAGAARGDAPTNNRAHPDISTETGLAHSQASHDAQIERRNSSGPDLRGDWGVETKAGACERPLDGLQPRATLD